MILYVIASNTLLGAGLYFLAVKTLSNVLFMNFTSLCYYYYEFEKRLAATGNVFWKQEIDQNPMNWLFSGNGQGN